MYYEKKIIFKIQWWGGGDAYKTRMHNFSAAMVKAKKKDSEVLFSLH